MKEEGGHTAASPSAAASSSPTASQENDQAQANAAAAPLGATSTKPHNGVHARQYAAGCGRRRGGGSGVRGPVFKGRSKHKSAQGMGNGASGNAACSKFISPEAVLSAAQLVKDSLPQLSPELLSSLKARGLEPCTLKEVRDERAESEHARLLEAFQRQCEGWGNNREGWVHSKWHSVIVCPDFKRVSIFNAGDVE
ncbi:uncharacterized protein EMH_0091520 [Eimeria mitis]|uniref:Uncharacterized protein n=1 Tax=Eimeria mitis TaxID=44415 RepID=U6KK02_9EIME|nr:uncharacterized protein EMH_0091520 [Eimeria mitis]CDJ36597.1 hypothetical protein EMH_0091520 [Eimeria mitis]